MSSSRQSGRIDIVATSLDPMHHGGGTDGNRQILRKQRFVHPQTGSHCRVPFISGNSLKHLIRDGCARFALEAMGVADGELTKSMIHLLFSGGALSGGGSSIKIGAARDLEALFPMLSLCGYSASNTMTSSRLSIDNLHLVCAENDWRMPEALRDHPHAGMRVGELIDDAFGTRHEPTRANHVARRMLAVEKLDSDNRSLDERIEAAIEDGGKKLSKPKETRPDDSAQMIYDFEVVKAGAAWWGGLYFDDCTDHELAALSSGLERACVGGGPDGGMLFRLAAKGSIGYGRVSARLSGSMRRLALPGYEQSSLPVPAQNEQPAVDSYVSHLRANRDAILKALKAAAK